MYIKVLRFVEKVSGILLAVLAISSGNIFICFVISVLFLAHRSEY